MGKIHRYYIPNATVFITCVTHNREPFLKQANIDVFWQTLKSVQEFHPFRLLAYVILPDHFHWLMLVPEENPNF